MFICSVCASHLLSFPHLESFICQFSQVEIFPTDEKKKKSLSVTLCIWSSSSVVIWQDCIFFFFRGASSWLFSYNVRYFLPNHYFDVIFICSLFVENSSRFRTVITFFYQRAENRFCLTYKYLLFDGYISSSLLCVWVIDNMVCYSINIFMTAVEPMMCWETLIIFQGKQRCSFSWEKILIYERFCFNVFLLEIYFFSVQVLIGHATSTTLTMSAVFSGFEWDP